MRLMGYQVSGDQPNTTAILVGGQKAQDNAMPVVSDGISTVEVPGQANMALQQFIIGNTKEGANYIPGVSPYVASNPTLSRPVTSTGSNEMPTAACANGDTACITGIGRQQNAPLTQQTREAIADAAALASRGAGVIAAGATAVAAGSSPQVRPIAGAVAIGATAIAVAADTTNYLANPDPKKFIREQIGVGFPASILMERFPLWAPIINEVAEEFKK